ncbi:FtsX-like permease family protein [Bariatricus massiliensis]|uniref:FtsX-like permease family protein n=1 Tax=Bariatricus massiliensis TaxID=1745713 RepID=A0ABS8DBX4_9FIRM|nr:FtsX-like permease family protein [Bariatricus massiliensis]MCB7303833.1 FtsX-like permease family protein [Bariatricus massiliensis]MCB7373249.1 FtsX-like permease family protein [Bariatricus massiliensis]MCB7385919.1 FtsX-like permease family protein [Bariatricus massiliensis]MCB7410081.1 FtsX-like permease family protein [Bariatricus massiliensis]MCQ5252951.1 FtsX-like permease family protein [Bariatricus massiliensis]
MLANNNRTIISHMAVRVLKRNKRRYGFLVTAVVLATFMVFSTLTVGETYFKMEYIQNLRSRGADYDAMVVGGIGEEQKRLCQEQLGVANAGMTAYSGSIASAGNNIPLRAGLVWGDEDYWEQLKKPVLKKLEGRYPQKENEIMVNAEIMEKAGLGDIKTGDTLTLTYEKLEERVTKEFQVSGVFSEYGNEKIFYVSKSFYEQSGYKLGYDGMLYIKFTHPIVPKGMQEELGESLHLNKRQAVIMTAETEKTVGILVGLASLVLFTCLSAWLLIYNILYLSVSGNIRYYGLMQTLGMTEGQIRLFWKKQMFRLGSVGITGGILLGAGVSFLLIPGIVKGLGIQEKNVEVSFQPAVLALSVLLAGITLYSGSRKAVKVAASAAPVDALGYYNYTGKKQGEGRHKSKSGRLLWRLAWRQMCQDKKKAAVVTLSLAAGLSVFLCMTVLIESHGARTIMPNYMDADMVIRNDTLYAEDEGRWTQIMDSGFISDLESDEGIAGVDVLLGAKMIVPWEPEFSDIWMREYYDMWIYAKTYEEIVGDYKQNPEQFYSFVKGIDEEELDYINSTLDTPVEKEPFLEGKSCILYRSGLSLGMDTFQGKRVTYYLDEENAFPYQMDIAGLTDDSYYGGVQGKAPVVIVSSSFLKQISDNPYILKVNIHYQEGQEAEAEKKIKGLIEESPYVDEISYDSKIEGIEKAEEAQGNIRIVGIGITVILVCIGLMNYVNTVLANIQNRQASFRIMESVGMTGRQLKGMLILEGIMFAAGALLITATAGVTVTYFTYQSMNYMDNTFRIPLLPAAGAAAVSLALCVAVPLVFESLRKRVEDKRQYR